MKKYNILLIANIIFGVGTHYGQNKLDTIQVNEHMNVALFFQSPIKQAITGSDNFVFSFDRERAGYFGLLQGFKAKQSNLLVVTMDNSIYAFVIDYGTKLERLNYFVAKKSRIGQTGPQTEGTVGRSGLVNGPRLDSISKVLLTQGGKLLASKRNRGVRLVLVKTLHYDRKVFLVFEINNRSGIDFEMDRLEIYQVIGSSNRRTSYQERRIDIIHSFQQPHIVKSGESKRFVLVSKMFIRTGREPLKFMLLEQQKGLGIEVKW